MTDKSQVVFSSIIHYFKDAYELKTSGKENIKLNARTFNPNQFHKKFSAEKDAIASFVGISEFYGIVEEIVKKRSITQEQAFEYMSDKIFGALHKQLNAKKVNNITTAINSNIKDNEFDYSKYAPILDVTSNKKVLYNTSTGKIYRDGVYATWKEWVNSRPTEDKKAFNLTITPALIKYDPYNVEEISYSSVMDQSKVVTFNAHITPNWRKRPIKDPKLPEIFVEFMEHLFPHEESRDYVYHWMNFMLTDRNHCILFLYGAQGTGKGTFNYILQKLVGDPNFIKLGEDFWQSRFNGEMKYRRCIFFDDCEITKENVTRIRGMTNRTIAIEEKGITTEDYTNHASYVWALNPDKRAVVTYDDRRYSVPVLGDEDIQATKGADWMDTMTKLINESEDFISQIGHWILAYGDQGRFNNTKSYITENFYTLVDKALTLWQKKCSRTSRK